MQRLGLVAALLAALLLPAEGLAGQMSFRLPFSLFGMGVCQAAPDLEVTASCRWQRNGERGYDVSCALSSAQPAIAGTISLDVTTWRTGANLEPRTQVTGQKFAYEYGGIGCTVFIPSSIYDLHCDRSASGFNCSWCGRNNCYEGKATLRQARN